MDKVKFLIFTLTFCELPVDLSACGKGSFRTLRGTCEQCPVGQYQPNENSNKCHYCTACETDRGSFMEQSCTKEIDTKCQCREGFVPWLDDTSTCKCEVGFGLDNTKCSKCENGYFNNQVNKPCIKWKECKYGVKISGNATFDVVCNEPKKSNPDITTPNTACSTPGCRQEQIPTENGDPTTITTTTISTPTTTAASPGHTPTTTRGLQPPTSSSTSNYTGLVLILFGIGALIILTAVTCKLHITPCVKNPSGPSKDSMCRRPVEEIGDGSLSSLKLNPEP